MELAGRGLDAAGTAATAFYELARRLLPEAERGVLVAGELAVRFVRAAEQAAQEHAALARAAERIALAAEEQRRQGPPPPGHSVAQVTISNTPYSEFTIGGVTIRACSCGALVAGGPSRCTACVDAGRD